MKVTKLVNHLLYNLIYQPTNIRAIISHTSNPAHSVKILNKLFPCRIGLEIDISSITKKQFSDLEGKLTKTKLYGYTNINQNFADYENNMDEIKFSIFSFNQVKDLYKAIKYLSKIASPNALGGNHIHIDLPVKGNKSSYRMLIRKKLKENFSLYIYKLIKDFKPQKYKYDNIDKYIKVYRNHETIEYRCFESSLNYIDIIKNILICHQVTYSVKNNTKLNKKLIELIERI